MYDFNVVSPTNIIFAASQSQRLEYHGSIMKPLTSITLSYELATVLNASLTLVVQGQELRLTHIRATLACMVLAVPLCSAYASRCVYPPSLPINLQPPLIAELVWILL